VPVAAGGTGVPPQHLQALREATGRDLTDLIVALDSDTAGCTAAARVWEALTPEWAAHARALEPPDDPAELAVEHLDTLPAALAGPVPLAWCAMAPNLQYIRSLDHSDWQAHFLRTLVDHLYDRVEIAQWPALVEHVARAVGNSPGRPPMSNSTSPRRGRSWATTSLRRSWKAFGPTSAPTSTTQGRFATGPGSWW
jgi:hypothetical protein